MTVTCQINGIHLLKRKFLCLVGLNLLLSVCRIISENSRKPLMNTVPSYENTDWLKPIFYNFLIWIVFTRP